MRTSAPSSHLAVASPLPSTITTTRCRPDVAGSIYHITSSSSARKTEVGVPRPFSVACELRSGPAVRVATMGGVT